jgi:hypothetical protein
MQRADGIRCAIFNNFYFLISLYFIPKNTEMLISFNRDEDWTIEDLSSFKHNSRQCTMQGWES